MTDHQTPAVMRTKKLSPYQRIMKAVKSGCGVRLSKDEVFQMSLDDAIATVAQNEDEAMNPRKKVKEDKSAK